MVDVTFGHLQILAGHTCEGNITEATAREVERSPVIIQSVEILPKVLTLSNDHLHELWKGQIPIL